MDFSRKEGVVMKSNFGSIGRAALASGFFLTLFIFVVEDGAAFKPDNADHGHKMITRSILTSGYSYKGKSVGSFSAMLSTGVPVSFSDAAATDVATGNYTTDWMHDDSVQINGVEFTSIKEFMDDTAHCDNDTVAECSLRVAKKLNMILWSLGKYALLTESGRTSYTGKETIGFARLHLGKALHTVQDFYAHSDHANRKSDTELFSSIYYMSLGGVSPFRRGVHSSGL